MKCVDFQNEFEEQNALSEDANLHLEHCENCREFKFEQNRVWEMLGGLGQVKAPKDFNFHVKARIAEAQSSGEHEAGTGFFPALRYVMPLGFVIILLSFVALSGLYFVGTQKDSPVITQDSPTPFEDVNLPNGDLPKDEVAEKDSSDDKTNPEDEVVNPSEKEFEKPNSDIVAENESTGGGSLDSEEKAPKIIGQPDKKEGGGSNDFTAEGQKEVRKPEGFNQNRKPKTRVNPNVSDSVDVKEVLELSGIVTASENSRLKVRSIRKNSVAERSGVKVGDLVEAINGQKITGEPLRGKSINVETITVLREGERRVITLKPN